eukprot:scaffold3733_cov77-Skeletonema_dohrnii-CCMP3373.AAC.4
MVSSLASYNSMHQTTDQEPKEPIKYGAMTLCLSAALGWQQVTKESKCEVIIHCGAVTNYYFCHGRGIVAWSPQTFCGVKMKRKA